MKRRPNLHIGHGGSSKIRIIEASHDLLGEYRLYCEDADELLFTENESNAESALGRSERNAVRKRLDQRLRGSR